MKRHWTILTILTTLIILGAATGICFGAEVTLSWNPNTEHDLKEYRLYQTFAPGEYVYGRDSENYVVTITAGVETVTIFIKDEDVDLLYWVITAVNLNDLESGPSNEVCIEEPEPPDSDGDSGCFILTISKIRRLK